MEKMYSIGYVNQKIRKIQEKYREEIKPNEEKYGEENTKKDLIIPILQILNWDTESKTEVDAEFCIKNIRSSGSADYALKIDGEIKLLIEAKAVDKVLETGYDIINGQKRTYVEQLVGYAFDLNRHMKTKIDYCILTNGKEWKIYYMGWKGVTFDKKLVYSLKLEEFIQKFPRFWDLEKNNVNKGSLSKYVFEDDRIRIDKKAVNDLLYCKKLLVDSMIKSYNKNERDMKYIVDKLINKPVSNAPETFPKFYEIQDEKERFSKFVLEASSNVINKILFIRIIEDKGFVKPKLTKQFVKEWKETWSTDRLQNIMKLFRDACEQAEDLYNGGLFRLNPYDELPYNNNIIEKIMGILGDFDFEEIDADVIGRIYEIYLGTVLSFEEEIRGKKRTKLNADYTERKKLGQYYTPKFVVDFIVKNTLGKLLEGKNLKEVSKIKVLDPACGSGSFLIRAFDYLKDYYIKYNDQQMAEVKKNGIGNMNNYTENGIIIDYNHRILKENLHGVDLNDLSVQICSINLWLRALEKDKKLEKLSKNILHGNSLVSGVESKEELSKYKDKLKDMIKLREEIKNYYGRELSRKERDLLEGMEDELLRIRLEINSEINENLKEYFENLDLVCPFNWEVEFTEVFNLDKSEEEQGFDVVIGNPPYFTMQSTGGEVQKYFEESETWQKFYRGQSDVLYYFIIQGLRLLREHGYLAFITSRYWLENKWADKLREFILEKTKIVKIIDFRNFYVFSDANIHTCIIILQKETNIKERLTNEMLFKNIYQDNIEETPQLLKLKFSKLKQESLTKDIWVLDERRTFLDKISKDCQTLGSINHVSKGMDTGLNKAFIIKRDTINRYNIEKNILKRVLKNSDINRYSIQDSEHFLIYTANETKISDYPNTQKYLGSFKKDLMERWEYKKHKCKWYRISTLRSKELFDNAKEKIYSPYRSTSNTFALDENNFYGMTDTTIIVPKDKQVNLKYLLAVLNSKLLNFYVKLTGKKKGNSFEYFADYLKRLPIKKINDSNKNLVEIISYKADEIFNFKIMHNKIIESFNQALSNQPIKEPKSCKFGHYFDHYELYGMERETSGRINEIKAKILSLDVKEEDNKLVIYMTNYNEEQDQLWEDIKAVKLAIKDEDVRKFLFFALKKYINGKGGRGFGSGNLLELLKNIEVPVYVANVKMNIDKIKDVMKEFNHLTKDLWFKDESKKEKFKSLNELEAGIKKTDREIDEMVYDLYGITEEEKKIIEASLK